MQNPPHDVASRKNNAPFATGPRYDRFASVSGRLAFTAVCLVLICDVVHAQAARRTLPRGVLERMDQNGDGVLEPSEIPERTRQLLETSTGVDLSKPVSIDELARDDRPRGGGGSSVSTSRPLRRPGGSSRRDNTEQLTSSASPTATELMNLAEASPEELSTIIVDVLLIQVTPHGKEHEEGEDEGKSAEGEKAAQMPVIGVLKKSISELIRNAPKTGEPDPALAKWLSASEESGRHEVTHYRLSAVNRQTVLQQFGQQVPTVQSSQVTQFGTVRNTTMQAVGTLLKMTPVVLSDGALMIDLQLEHSAIGPEDEGTVISENNGEQVRQPALHTLTTTSRIRTQAHEPVIVCDRVVTSQTGTMRFAMILTAHVQTRHDQDVVNP